MKNTWRVAFVSLLAVSFLSAPHAHAALLSSQPDSSGTPLHYWHSDGTTGAYLIIDPHDNQPGFSIGTIATTDSSVVGIHIKVQYNTSGVMGYLQKIPYLFDETGAHPYACAQEAFTGNAYGTAADATAHTNPLTAAQYNNQMIDMYFRCAVGTGHETVYANTSYRLYFYSLSVADVFDVYLAANAAGVPFYEISGDGTYPVTAPITISAPQQGTTYFTTDTIIPQATIANLSSYTTVTYLLNGSPVNPTQPLPLSTLPAGPATLVIAATNSLGNTTYATSTFMVQRKSLPLTVTADNKTMTFGGALPALTASLGGFVSPDTATSSDVTGSALCTTTATASSTVGSYPITCTTGSLASANNYTFTTFVKGTLTVTQAPSVTTVTCPASVTYTGTAQTPCSATVSGTGGLSLALTPTYANNINIGTASASASFAGDANHSASSNSKTFAIVYRWDGFLQPINDTAHQIGLAMSVFKGGSTVPVKFQLKNASGTVVQASAMPLWNTPQLLGPMSSSIDELMYTDPASSGNLFKWDGTQYQYNWSTQGFASGNWYRISAQLDDGTSQSVVIGLR